MMNEYPKVNILLSSYNGEKYIAEQLESLLSQTYPNIEVFIRDDGSADNTREILNRYFDNERFHITLGENVGFIKSFLYLLRGCDKADFYAFCDQDDVWLPDKISRAVEALSKENGDAPVLYFSNYDFYDEQMRFLSHAKAPSNLSFANCLVDCAPLGFTSVMNDCARSTIIKNLPEHSCGHDWWAYMVCTGLGKVIFDNYPTTKYRRTGNNVSNGGASFLKFQIWRFKKFFLGDYFSNITEMLRDYERIYGKELSNEKQDVLMLFSEKNFSHAINKIFYPHMFRQNITDEVFLRLCFMLGRL